MFNFSSEDIKKCKEFSENVDTSFYSSRNQWDENKRKADSYIGKLGELLIYNYLKPKYPEISYPDFNIYKPREKSWDYDLKHPFFNLHVKSQESIQSAKYGVSWIFQNTDKHIFKEYSDKDYVGFVGINILNKSGEIKAIVQLKLLHENLLFKLPILEKLQKANKLAVYYKDLEEKLLDNLMEL
jgi:hypothetical protein